MFFSQLFRPGCITTYPNSGCMAHFSRLTRWAKKILKFQKFYKISEWSLSPAIDQLRKSSKKIQSFKLSNYWYVTLNVSLLVHTGNCTSWSANLDLFHWIYRCICMQAFRYLCALRWCSFCVYPKYGNLEHFWSL